MKLSRLSLIAALVVAGTALNAPRANAVPVSCAPGGGGSAGSVSLGLGGFFSGCWGGYFFAALYENAGDVSTYSIINPGTGLFRDAITNDITAPTTRTDLYNDNCGSSGAGAGNGKFCPAAPTALFAWGSPEELILQERKAITEGVANPFYMYSGSDPTRNTPPTPPGLQEFLWIVSGGFYNGWYLMGWEDKNSGCLVASSNTSGLAVTGSGAAAIAANTVDGTKILTGSPNDNPYLNDLQGTCTSFSGGTPGTNASDDDFNDFYMLIRPYTPDEFRELTPEPMTMSLLATGLLGIGGASLRRRKNRK